jgi:hypothetical protein
MATINASQSAIQGQAFDITATGLAASDGDSFTWNTSQGSSFNPNPSNVSGGVASTTYTPGSPGTDTISGSDSNSADSTSADVVISGASQPSNPSWTSDPTVISTLAAVNTAGDLTSTAACGPVKAFQSAVGAAGGPNLSVDGGYGPATAAAAGQVAAVNGGNAQAAVTSFPNCGGAAPPTPPQPPGNLTQPSSGWPMWLKIVLWIIALGGAIGLGLWLWKTFGSSRPMAAEPKRKRGKRTSKKR